MEIQTPTPFLNFRDRLDERKIAVITKEQYAKWKQDLEDKREDLRKKFSQEEYERSDLSWYCDAVVEHITFMYDLSFYELGKGYKIDEFLDHGEREFGGYDIIMLWHAYPRIGCDERNQFDFYREMPGGLTGLRKVVDRCHKRGVKVFIDYNPWDTGTRREGKSDHESVTEIVVALDADGIFLDTMSASNDNLRKSLDAVRPGVVFETEGSPTTEAAEVVTGSWGHFNPNFGPRFFWHNEFPFIANTHLTMKWLEPRHSTRVMERHSQNRTIELYPAFFNGLGTVVWENVFGWWNPWSPADKKIMRKITSLLRNHQAAFQDKQWQPMIPTLDEYVMANEWIAGGETVWTMINLRFETTSSEILAVPHQDGAIYYDAWNNYREIAVRTESSTTYIPLTIESRAVGCIVRSLFGRKKYYSGKINTVSDENFKTCLEDNLPSAPKPVVPDIGGFFPAEMVKVPSGVFTMKIEHRPREGACYDDISHCWGNAHPTRTLEMHSFLIDRFPVTNNDFKDFLIRTGYEPLERANFLKHWIDNEVPSGLGDHPVVNIDLEDARAYAHWAKKRLPTEEEWQYAAGGNDGRFWPWGNQDPVRNGQPDEYRCNSDSRSTTAVDTFPDGVSPFGVWDMAGNVWELTESERNDGHSRYVMLKGGSYYEAKGSRWYFDGGAQRCTTHAKFLLMWSGLDRCSTIGFRCVKEIGQEES
ncbi:MAG: SUMF1/EgtB/PvdO family nonheme iron enzyme [Bacteroidetes bacterium]|nr:SUMF1/EgtB/PvdO family nonheme iron enzyme [Bacteroidota bacterium]